MRKRCEMQFQMQHSDELKVKSVVGIKNEDYVLINLSIAKHHSMSMNFP